MGNTVGGIKTEKAGEGKENYVTLKPRAQRTVSHPGIDPGSHGMSAMYP